MDHLDDADAPEGRGNANGSYASGNPHEEPAAAAVYQVNGGVLALLRPSTAPAMRAENVAATVLTHLASFLFLHEVIAAQCVCKPWRAALKGTPAHGLFRCLSVGVQQVGTTSTVCDRPPLGMLWCALATRRLLSIQVFPAQVADMSALAVLHPYDGEAGSTNAPTDAEVAEARKEAQTSFGKWRAWLLKVAEQAARAEVGWSAWRADRVTAEAEETAAAEKKAQDADVERKAATTESPAQWEHAAARANANAVCSLRVHCDCDPTRLSPTTSGCCQQVIYDVLRLRDATAGPLACEFVFRPSRLAGRAAPEMLAVEAIWRLAALWATADSPPALIRLPDLRTTR